MKTDTQKILHHVINGCPIEILNYKNDSVGIQFSKANGYYFIGDSLHITYEGGSTGKSMDEFKLILYPLSGIFGVGDNPINLPNQIKENTISHTDFEYLIGKHYDVYQINKQL